MTLIIIIIIKNIDNVWKFDGSLSPESNGEAVPPTLYNFIRWILDGPRNDIVVSQSVSLGSHCLLTGAPSMGGMCGAPIHQTMFSHTCIRGVGVA